MTDHRAPGRPRIYGEPATERIHVRVTAPVRLELERIADLQGRRISDVVRQLIDDRVDDGDPSDR